MNKKLANRQHFQHRLKPAYVAVLLAFAVQTAQANPTGGTVANGSASFATSGSTLTVTNTPGTIINWQGFSIGSNEITKFAQQSASSTVLNRVVGNDPSNILGKLSSNGRVFLVNPNGILFGASAIVDVAGLVASTLNLSDADFIAGNNHFTAVPGAANISNAGSITAQDNGQIYLIAPNVENSGVITAPNGEILLAAGASVDLVNSNDPNLRVNITAPAGDATNVGKLIASSGSLGLFGSVVRNSGAVSADSATMQGGKIVFKASQRVDAGGVISAQGAGGGTINMLADKQSGTVNVTGTLDASAPVSGNGGFIETSAANVQIADSAHITTAATNGNSGNWLIDPVDFTIAASGGNITGSLLSSMLTTSSVTIQTATGSNTSTNLYGTTGTNGDIFVNDVVAWHVNTLTLNASRNIYINDVLNANLVGAGPSLAGLELFYGQGAVAAGNTANYVLGPLGRVDLSSLGSFKTQLGSDGTTITYTIIDSLGNEGSLTGTDLQGMNFDPTGNYVLGADINASATSGWTGGGFAPVGIYTFSPNPYVYTPYTGQFDGLGHTISNLYINRPTENYVGLFGYTSGANFRNVALTGVNITGMSSVGGLVGVAYGAISNSSVSGTVTGTSNVGGLEGSGSSTISDSFASGIVAGTSYVGGLSGGGDGTISNSYVSSSALTGTSYVGGLVGSNNGALLKNSHYDIANVTINGSSQITLGALYTVQYQDWFNSGLSLNIANYSASLIPAGVNSFSINSPLGLRDMLGFADNAAYTFSLAANIDLANDPGLYIPYLAADFNGKNFTISTLSVTLANDNLGLFGHIASGSTVSNVQLSNAAVTGRSNIGVLAGLSDGTINTSSSTTGNVAGNSKVGGLVGQNNGMITQSHVSGSTVTGSSNNVGGLAGYNYGTISGSYASGGSVTGSQQVGGLVGYNRDGSGSSSGVRTGGIISTSYVSGGTVSSSGNDVGGLVGYNYYGTVSNSHVDTGTMVNGFDYVGGLAGYDSGEGFIHGNTVTGTTVSGNSNVGGLIGYVGKSGYSTGYTDNNHVVNSIVNGGTGSSGLYVGGLIGWNGGIVSNSYASGGTVAGYANVGGLAGYNSILSTNSNSNNVTVYGGKISNSYVSSGSVTGSIDVGGLVGNNAGTISASHVSGGSVIGSSDVGGLSGYNIGAIDKSYVTAGNVTGVLNAGGLVGLNGVSASGSSNISAAGTISNSYVNNGTVVSGGNNVGGLVGKNDGTSTAGGVGASITGSYVSGGTVSASSSNVGGLVGDNAGSISGNYANGGSVITSISSGNANAGGLVGNNSGLITAGYASNGSVGGSASLLRVMGGLVGNNSGSISQSFVSKGTVSGYSSIGGLAGRNSGTISNTYASGGTVSGSSDVGGLVGYNTGSISTSYASVSMGSVGSYFGGLAGYNDSYGGAVASNNFWNTTVATGVSYGIGNDGFAAPSNIGAIGMTDANMKTMANFNSATVANGNVNPGWDISSNLSSGSVWYIADGVTMPLLSFAVSPTTNVTPNVIDEIVDIVDQREKPKLEELLVLEDTLTDDSGNPLPMCN